MCNYQWLNNQIQTFHVSLLQGVVEIIKNWLLKFLFNCIKKKNLLNSSYKVKTSMSCIYVLSAQNNFLSLWSNNSPWSSLRAYNLYIILTSQKHKIKPTFIMSTIVFKAINVMTKYSNLVDTTSFQILYFIVFLFFGIYLLVGRAFIAKSIHCFCGKNKNHCK